ncbi:MAG: RDD family protein [Planctomycetota bacterium]|jgi:uncharacterized RDD family membrane protein YckC
MLFNRLNGKCQITQSYAGLWARVLAFAFDYLAIALYLVVISAVSLTVQLAFPNVVPRFLNNPVSCQIFVFCIITLPVALYFALFESSPRQATWGKRRQRLKVIRTNGERLTPARSIGRTFLKFIPWEVAHTCIWQVSFARQEPSPMIMVGFVLVWILVGANVVMYDWLAGTYVVKG